MAVIKIRVRAFRRNPNGMPWGEAFERTSNHFVWLVIWSLVFEIVLIPGALIISWGLDDVESRKAALALGIGLIVWSLVSMVFIGMGVWLKASTDTVAENVEKRIAALMFHSAPGAGNGSTPQAHPSDLSNRATIPGSNGHTEG